MFAPASLLTSSQRMPQISPKVIRMHKSVMMRSQKHVLNLDGKISLISDSIQNSRVNITMKHSRKKPQKSLISAQCVDQNSVQCESPKISAKPPKPKTSPKHQQKFEWRWKVCKKNQQSSKSGDSRFIVSCYFCYVKSIK